MSTLKIDFNNLKYNLYDVLGIPQDSTNETIKKSFIKIVKKFHPDKNNALEEEIYYHIILANQILSNNILRQDYDNYLNITINTFNELKNTFEKDKKDLETILPPKEECINNYKNKIEELNKKHGYNDINLEESTMDKFNIIKQKREDIQITKEHFKDNDEFNNKFEDNKTEGKYKDQIIEYTGNVMELTAYTVNDNYTSLEDMDKLYVEDTVQHTKFSSLNRAFTINPVLKYENTKTLEEKMKEYKLERGL